MLLMRPRPTALLELAEWMCMGGRAPGNWAEVGDNDAPSPDETEDDVRGGKAEVAKSLRGRDGVDFSGSLSRGGGVSCELMRPISSTALSTTWVRSWMVFELVIWDDDRASPPPGEGSVLERSCCEDRGEVTGVWGVLMIVGRVVVRYGAVELYEVLVTGSTGVVDVGDAVNTVLDS